MINKRIILLLLFSTNKLMAIDFTITPKNPKPQEHIFVNVKGEWGNSCVPKFENVEIVGNHMKMYATTYSKSTCEHKVSSYSLDFKPNDFMRFFLTSEVNYYFLEFYISTDETKIKQLYAFDIIRIQKENDNDLAPESGFWWVDSEGEFGAFGKGSGFSIDRQNDHITVMAQFYDESGLPIWYYSEGMLDRGVYKSRLSKITGGQALNSVQEGLQQVEDTGQLIITFDSQLKATTWIVNNSHKGVMESINLQAISIRRYQNIKLTQASIFLGDWIFVGESKDSEILTIRCVFDKIIKENDQEWHVSGVNHDLFCKVKGGKDKFAQSCLLQDKDKRDIAEFDDIGLSKLLGIKSNSQLRVQLIKIK